MPQSARIGLASLIICTSCGGGSVVPANPPQLDRVGQSSCHVTESQMRPYVVEWSGGDRGDLERLASQGTVAVRYDGCAMQVLRDCRVKHAYKYTPLTPKHDHLSVKDQDELYASLPLGAAKLEAKLAQAGELDVSMTVVGTLETDADSVTSEDLTGSCAGASHVVAGITVGAFEFYAGAHNEAAAGAEAPAGGVKVAAKSGRETLMSDGDQQACSHATRGDQVPPEGCSAILRLEVVPLGAHRVVTPLPTVDLGEFAFVPRIPKARASVDVAALQPPDEMVVAALDRANAQAWTSVTALLRTMRAEVIAQEKVRSRLADCRRTGCRDEGALTNQLRAIEAHISKEKAQFQARRDLALANLTEAISKEPSPGVAFAAGMLRENKARFETDDAAVTGGLVETAKLYTQASTMTEADSPLAWWTLFNLGYVWLDAGNENLSHKAFSDLLRLSPRPGTAEIAWRVGDFELDRGHPDAAIDAYQAGLRAVTGPHSVIRNLLDYKLMVSQLQVGHYADSLQSGLTLQALVDDERKRSGDTGGDFSGEVASFAAACVEKLGGIDRAPLGAATPPTAGRIAMQVARRALDRDDLVGATKAWQFVVARASDTLDAPAAYLALAAAREELGDDAGARDARDKLATYSLTSPWATGLRASRDPSGRPSDDDIRGALSAPLPRLPAKPTSAEGLAAAARARLSNALDACKFSGGAPLPIEVEVVEGRPAKVIVHGGAPDVATCLVNDGPGYFGGAASSIKAVVHLDAAE
jgi:tetratricopeptide (TPR) repeat protein